MPIEELQQHIDDMLPENDMEDLMFNQIQDMADGVCSNSSFLSQSDSKVFDW